MDRMHYRGPKWDGIGIPKTLMEEENPVYRPREQEEHPSVSATEEEGHKEFEQVVRWFKFIVLITYTYHFNCLKMSL